MTFSDCLADVCLVVLSVLFPPLPVWIISGICSCDSFINILLSLLGFLPGVLHSWYIISSSERRAWMYRGNHSRTAHDIENQIPRHGSPQGHHCHHHYHIRADNVSQNSSTPMTYPNYGSTNNDVDNPPAYSEVERGINKVQT